MLTKISLFFSLSYGNTLSDKLNDVFGCSKVIYSDLLLSTYIVLPQGSNCVNKCLLKF